MSEENNVNLDDYKSLKRDKNLVKNKFVKKNNLFYAKEITIIEFPSWYANKNIAEFGDEVYFYGIAAIIVGDAYSVMTIPTLCRTKPFMIQEVKRGEEVYTQLLIGEGQPLLTTNGVIKETLLSYEFFNNFTSHAKVPWFIDYLDFVKCYNNLVNYAASNVGANPIANEVIVSFNAREKKNPEVFYRMSDMKERPQFVGLTDLIYAVKSVIGKISGGYLKTGIRSSIVIGSGGAEPTDQELHLRD